MVLIGSQRLISAHNAVRFNLQVCTLREEYADMLQDDEEWSEAAKVLMAIPLESGGR